MLDRSRVAKRKHFDEERFLRAYEGEMRVEDAAGSWELGDVHGWILGMVEEGGKEQWSEETLTGTIFGGIARLLRVEEV